MNDYPYADRFKVYRTLPEECRDPQDIRIGDHGH